MSNNRQRVVSGIRTSGELHLGNYLGALKRFVTMQDHYEGYFFLADLHGLTTIQDPEILRGSIRRTANVYLACGLDPDKCVFYRQSAVPELTELTWLLMTVATMGELSRMTQFKDKTEGQRRESVGAGLFTYPVLMASDILLYKPDSVPVGEDQKQHVELARDVATRFNYRFGETFKLPEPMIQNAGARIKGLDNPAKKMSKSAPSSANYIAFSDSPKVIRQKISKAVTDTGSDILAQDDKPAITNLLNIYSLLSEISISELEKRYQGKGYKQFKDDLTEVVLKTLKPIQTRLAELESDPASTEQILRDGASKARPVAEKTLDEAKRGVGLI